MFTSNTVALSRGKGWVTGSQWVENPMESPVPYIK